MSYKVIGVDYNSNTREVLGTFETLDAADDHVCNIYDSPEGANKWDEIVLDHDGRTMIGDEVDGGWIYEEGS